MLYVLAATIPDLQWESGNLFAILFADSNDISFLMLYSCSLMSMHIAMHLYVGEGVLIEDSSYFTRNSRDVLIEEIRCLMKNSLWQLPSTLNSVVSQILATKTLPVCLILQQTSPPSSVPNPSANLAPFQCA